MLYPFSKKSKPSLFILAACFLFALSGMSTVFAETILRLHGSNTIGAKLAPALATQYLENVLHAKNVRYVASNTPQEGQIVGELSNKPVAIEIHAHGSSTSFRSLLAGQADIGMSSRPIKAKEIIQLGKLANFADARNEHVAGLDGIAVIVPKHNPIRQLSKQQLADIFAGKITRWSQLGIKLGKIKVYARDDKSGTYDTFKNLVLGKKRPLTKSAKRYESNAQLSNDVAADKNAIGFVGLPYVRQSRAVPISDGDSKSRFASEFNVVTEDYALSRRLFMYASSNSKNQHVKDFMKLVSSEAGQETVRKIGFISQNVYANKVEISENYPEEYRNFVKGAYRLSVNFRFKPEDLKLDSRGYRDIDRVAKYIRTNAKDKKVMLFGFSEDSQIPMHNISLSEVRADQVADSLKEQDIVIHHVRGYGFHDPVADNTQKSKNRRVEVWIK